MKRLLSILTLSLLLTLSIQDNFKYEENLKSKDAPNAYLNPCNGCQGKIVKETYKGINGDNALNVYLPVGYDETKKYNIFYLMHGGGENENTIFSNDVSLQNLLDHAIKNGELEPLIVVTPTYNKCDWFTFYKELRESVIPFVEEKYSTYAESTSEADIKESRRHRAFGGFSMGSVTTWAVLRNSLDIIAYYMPLSGGADRGGDPVQHAKGVTDAIEKSGLTPRDYFIIAATGSDDIAGGGTKSQIEEMKKREDLFTYTSDLSKGNLYYLESPGKTHWWGYVKHYVWQVLPYFFHE